MVKTKKQHRPLSLQTETLRKLTVGQLGDVGGGRPTVSALCSVQCTTWCSGGG